MIDPRKWSRRTAAYLAISSLSLAGAVESSFASAVYDVTDGGVVDAAGCLVASCGPSQTFSDTIESFATVSGSIMIDTGGATLDLTLALDDTVNLLASGGDDNGVSSIEFSEVAYSVSGLSLIEVIPGSKYIVGGGQTASVSGVYSQNASPSGFAPLEARVTGTCDIVGLAVTCGLSFGATNFELAVGTAPESRYFRHTMNLTGIVPEPSTALLLSLGLVGLAVVRR